MAMTDKEGYSWNYEAANFISIWWNILISKANFNIHFNFILHEVKLTLLMTETVGFLFTGNGREKFK